ncbi:SDR family NAD(P)-dependent oxidoreductase [Chloroflexota bacterium]
MAGPSFSLEGKVALITGAKRGLGKAMALAFAGAGADIAICTRAMEDGLLLKAADEIRQLGRRSLAVQTDVRYKDQVDKLVARVLDEFGQIDILVNNVATLIPSLLLDMRLEDWEHMITTDLTGYLLPTQAVGKHMVSRKQGSIINMASVNGVRTKKGIGLHSICKAATIMFTRVLALELAEHNIRVNAIAPGLTRVEHNMANCDDPEYLKNYTLRMPIPMGRVGTPDDIVGAAVYLASDAASYVTGDVIQVDGGTLA